VSAVLERVTASTQTVPLSEAVEINPKPDRGLLSDDLDVSFVPMAMVEAGTGNIDATTVRKYAEVKKGYTYFRDGDVLFAKITPCMENGKMAVARHLRNGIGFGSTEFHVLRSREGVDPHYIYHFVASSRFRAEAAHHMAGAVGQKRVPTSFLERAEIPLPPIEDQRRIVAEIEKQFSRLDQAIANLKRVNANLKRYKAGVLKAAVEGRLVDCASPGNWVKVPLGTVTEVQLGQQRAPVHAVASEQIPYIRTANVTWAGIDLTDVKTMGFPNAARYRLQVGDVLLAEASGSANEVGKPAIWNGEIPGACYQKTLIRIRMAAGLLTSRFVYYFFLHTCLSGQFARLAPGVGILHLTAERMLAWPICVPSLSEQHRIVAEVDRCLSLSRGVEHEVEANLQRAAALKQSILHEAFRGNHICQNP